MNDPQDDLSQARAWLLMDPKEHANRVAEMAKQSAKRKAAIAYADANSKLPDSASFIAIDGTKWCTAEAAFSWSDQVRMDEQEDREKEVKQTNHTPWPIFLRYLAIAAAAAIVVGLLIGWAAWRIGGGT